MDQLKKLITAEFDARGIDIAPSVIDVNADMLRTEQQAFGRARAAIKVIRMLKSTGGDVIRLIKHVSDEDPEWLQPPDRAAYPIMTDYRRYSSVELDAEAHDWLVCIRTKAPRHLGTWVLIDVWLTREVRAGPLVVHIGERRVGTVRSNDATAFDRSIRAAAMFDEDPFVQGRLVSAGGAGPGALEIPLPEART